MYIYIFELHDFYSFILPSFFLHKNIFQNYCKPHILYNVASQNIFKDYMLYITLGNIF